MGFFDRISEGLTRSRDKFKEQMNILLDRGPDVDEEFWETLEETLILSDFGAAAADAISAATASSHFSIVHPLSLLFRRSLYPTNGSRL